MLPLLLIYWRLHKKFQKIKKEAQKRNNFYKMVIKICGTPYPNYAFYTNATALNNVYIVTREQ